MELDFGTYDLHATMPELYPARQPVSTAHVEDVAGETQRQLLASGLLAAVGPGKSIAITAGSRGITSLPQVVRGAVAAVRQLGGEPFVIPAMGSHGGGTAEGQTSMLAELGVTPDSVGAPIRATMDVVSLGRMPGGPLLYMDAYAAAADGIIVINRVKPHSDFRGAIESGLAKMVVIGMGKRHGADAMHHYGAPGFRNLMPTAAQTIIPQKPFLAGVAIVENGLHQVDTLAVLPPSEFGRAGEAQLLERARKLLPSLPFERLDVLVVDRIGKNFSGAGMDTAVIGRIMVPEQEDNPRPIITAVVALDISPESHGNAAGLGMADVTTRRLVEQIDFHATYLNGITSGTFGLRRSSIPFVMQDDQTAVSLALHAASAAHPDAPRLVRIANTLDVGTILISPALVEEAQSAGCIVGPSLGQLAFDAAGRITPWPAQQISEIDFPASVVKRVYS